MGRPQVFCGVLGCYNPCVRGYAVCKQHRHCNYYGDRLPGVWAKKVKTIPYDKIRKELQRIEKRERWNKPIDF